MNEREPDVERHTSMGMGDGNKFEQSITKRSAVQQHMILDQIIDDDCARLPMKEKGLFDERIPL